MVKLPLPKDICAEINSYLCSSSCLAIHLDCYVGEIKCVGVDTVLMAHAQSYLMAEDNYGLYQVITDDCYGWETKFTPYGRFRNTKNLEKGGVYCSHLPNKFHKSLFGFNDEMVVVDGSLMKYEEAEGFRLIDMEKMYRLTNNKKLLFEKFGKVLNKFHEKK